MRAAAMHPAPATYLSQAESAHRLGNDMEHTHRRSLKALLEGLNEEIITTNKPRRIECGAPDLAITRKSDGLIVGLEAKDGRAGPLKLAWSPRKTSASPSPRTPPK